MEAFREALSSWEMVSKGRTQVAGRMEAFYFSASSPNTTRRGGSSSTILLGEVVSLVN